MTSDLPPESSPSPAARTAPPSRTAPPTATYRLQLQPGFPFAAAARVVPYVASLGVSHLHLSPVLEAVPGSAHGYDVTGHARVREELGGEEGLRALARTAREHGLGIVLDIVPNHMGVPAPERLNEPLWEVLREGPASPYARWFDIDWEAGDGRVLLPVLGGRLGDELRALSVQGGVLTYYDHRFPLRAGTEDLPLPELLDAQHYRLAWWRLARTELNYRRFFTISDLIGLRVEDPEVFAATHECVLRLVREGVVDGLRVDHPDGLADPGAYLLRLREETGGVWTVVEKILGPAERLPVSWPVAGTTGYDALRHLDGLFTDPVGHAELVRLHRESTGAAPDEGGEWEATVRRAAREVVAHDLAAEVERLTRTAAAVCETAPGLALRDHAPWALRTAIRETLVRLPVYRPYTTAGGPVSAEDRAMLEEAAEGAREAFAVPEEAASVDVVRDLALGRLGTGAAQRDFCARFAQVSAALRAKSEEDTAFYRYTPLLSANEVGGSPENPLVAPEEFHAYCARLQRDWPATGTVLSTHDTKRSADVRAAIAVLSECPERWAGLLAEAAEETLRTGGVEAPDRHLAWSAWQTAYGMGFPEQERLVPALLKAVREAGLRTSWTEPDPGYEEAVERFAAAGPGGPPLHTVTAFARELREPVRANVLGAALLHLTMPGVPDLYMGTERVYAALVDPDNRRLPGFPAGEGAADEADTAARDAEDLTGALPPGLSEGKRRLTVAALRLRREHPEWFGAAASYEPLRAGGPAADHCVAFTRSGAVATVVTRLSLRLAGAGGWRDTALELPPGRWRDALDGRTVEGAVPLAELLARSPAVLLVRD
ncbi:malto-oligosyltrehalose synthase [Streptomyces sp. TRM 70361]|uniref:malto-oligosyltrehalose synthase n=1 Tax=Streptomyces sp. TRM 70361 TaxID=3116553 RepID=UPI002E7BDD15|nr:malto-oligosyltrehalose synthase [Streptomyces sp. TRM 70361]MEE1941093.1 malto-oligosyltrehalose synthase [Streptomyces sp. TRM 70361]